MDVRKKAFAYKFEPHSNMDSEEEFLMIRIQNVCGKAILIGLFPILVGVTYDGIICSKTPLRVAPINVVKNVMIHIRNLYCPPLPRMSLTWQIA